MEIPDHLICLLRNLYAGQEATVRTGHGTTNWLQIGKEYIKAVYCHSAYLTYRQSTSRETLAGWSTAGWSTAGIKIARRNINNLRYADDTIFMAENKEELKSLLMKVKKGSEKASSNLTFKKWRSWHLVPSLMANIWGNNGNSDRLFWGAPKSLQMVTAAMKLKDAYSLEGKLWPT